MTTDWTPDQPLRHDATQAQIGRRYAWLGSVPLVASVSDTVGHELASAAKPHPAPPEYEAKLAALEADAMRWRALFKDGGRVRVLGSAKLGQPGYQHIGVELWTEHNFDTERFPDMAAAWCCGPCCALTFASLTICSPVLASVR